MHDYDGVYEYRFEIDSENTLTARDIMGHAVGNYPVSMESLLGDYVPHEPSHFLEGGN